MKVLMVDPPLGWKYGFPKAWDNKEELDLNKWLLANGYSQRLLDQFKDGMYCRFWEEEVEE